MKRCLLHFLAVMLSMMAYAQKVIQMEKEGGVYKIPCFVNGARMKMVFDTGASSVSLSLSIANYLYDNDYITKEDIVGSGKSQVADGSIVDHYVINLRDIEIEGMHLKNVEATVIASQDAPLLLGQSAIQKLGAVTINGNSLIINNAKSSLSDEEVVQLRDKAIKYWLDRSYFAAIELYSVLRKNFCLNTEDYLHYIMCCFDVNQYERIIELFKEWENGLDYSKDENKSIFLIYSIAGDAYRKNKDYKSMIYCLEKGIAINQKEGYKPNAKDCESYANAYFLAGMYDMARKYYIEAIREYLSLNKNTIADIYRNKISDNNAKEGIGFCLVNYALILRIQSIIGTKTETYLLAGAAKCGNEIAKEKCDDYNINYRIIRYNSKYDYLF